MALSISRRAFMRISGTTILAGTLGNSCDTTGTFEDIFRVKQFSCSKLRAENGETLTLTWDYAIPEALTAQRLRFLRLHLSDIAEEIVDLDLDARSFTFTFNGPITVEIQGTSSTVDTDNPFRPAVAAGLNVNKLQDLFFRGEFRSASNTPLAPYLGYIQDDQGVVVPGTIDVEFTQFVGFFDANNSGRIEPLDQFGSSSAAFRALSIRGEEEQGFGFIEGPEFPLQLFSNPQLGQTNSLIFAGAIAMNGRPLPYKADDGDGTARASVSTGQATPPAPLGFDPIFVAIVLLEEGPQLTIADIQIGNLNQKLVATVSTNPLLLSTSSPGTPSVTVNRPTSLSTGVIKSGQAGIAVTPANGGDPFDALVGFNLEWRTEYMRDEDILNVISTG